jgi:acyl carrier protein phosphodiesterase
LNYLAHLYLSGPDSGIITGNFIADAVKGKNYLNYSDNISKGILFHRFIDSFTDQNPVVNLSKQRLRQSNGKYAGVVVDVFYDHFLAVHWEKFSEETLDDFAIKMYDLLLKNENLFPEKSKRFLEYMVSRNILVNYKEPEGIERVLQGMSRRTPFPSNMENSLYDLQLNYAHFEKEFLLFFPEIIKASHNFLLR